VTNFQKKSVTAGLHTIRVMIADEEASFRNWLRMSLEHERDVTIVGEACDANGLLALAGELKPDVLLIDAALLGSLNGRLEALVGISTLATVPTIDRANMISAFLHGAKAVVPKPSARRVWPESIRAVVAGQYWLGRESIAILVLALHDYFSQRIGTKSAKDYKLTPREIEIIDKIVNGHSNKEVGEAFSIRERTVKHHLTNIFTKLGVSSRLELALFAVNHRLLEVPPVCEAMSAGEGSFAEFKRNTDRESK
jgi:DNA-binding NarL/FixJ family response regulator